MSKIDCEIQRTDLDNDRGTTTPSVVLTCARCGHQTESYGQRGRSVRRCLTRMGEECPAGDKNFYVTA